MNKLRVDFIVHNIKVSQCLYRICCCPASTVSFAYKDYADNNKQKVMTLSRVELIRRFLLHVLPGGLMRIRHYGFLSNSKKKELQRCSKQL